MSIVFSHKPVLLKKVLETFDYLRLRKDPVFVDGTVGLAGHSLAIAKQCQMSNVRCQILGIDKDSAALKAAKSNVRCQMSDASDHFIFIHDDFKNYENIIQSMNINPSTPSASLGTSRLGAGGIDGVLLDLGVSSMQLDDKNRGFSFQDPEMPLDMRMDQGQTKTAASILNSYSISELEQMLKRGEERYAKIIAKNAVQFRKNKKISTVADLLTILEKSIPLKIQKTGKTHYSTATFRALRLETNDEIEHLDQSIRNIVKSLKPKSRLAIITFHSIEDRIVKQTFNNLAQPCTCPPKFPYCVCGKKPSVKLITKKPIIPSEDEIKQNPRSRSAKLRVVEKN